MPDTKALTPKGHGSEGHIVGTFGNHSSDPGAGAGTASGAGKYPRRP